MIIQSIKRGAKSFAQAFRAEYRAQLVARGNRALQDMHAKLDELSPAEHDQLRRDTDEVLKRAAEINAARAKKDER